MFQTHQTADTPEAGRQAGGRQAGRDVREPAISALVRGDNWNCVSAALENRGRAAAAVAAAAVEEIK